MTQIEDEKQLFEIMGIPLQWKMKACELKHSADVLWIESEKWAAKFNEWFEKEKNGEKPTFEYRPFVFHVYKMLAGFTIENLLKGIILIEHPEFVENGKLDRTIKSHDLLELAELAKISLTQNEKIFCGDVTEAVNTSGRYPIPTTAKQIRTSITIGGHIRDVFEALYDKLYKMIPPENFPKQAS